MLCSALSDQVVVVAPHMMGDEQTDSSLPYPVHRYRKWPRLNAVKVVLTTFWLGLQVRPTVCLISGYYSCHFAAGFWLMRQVGSIPYALITYGLDMSLPEPRLVEAIKRFLLRHADLIITISEASRRSALVLGASEAQIKLLFPCVDTTVFRHTDPNGLRRRLRLDGKRVILTVGRLVRRKAHKMVLQALAALGDKIPDLAYLVVGEGPERAELTALTRALQLQGRVIFTGFVPDDLLPQYYSLCDVFVMPSDETTPGDYEGFGIVYLEANACGKPVIAGKAGGAPDAVIDEETGLLVDAHDVDAIAAAILRLLTDSDLAHRLGENGRQRVEQAFASHRLAQRFARLVGEG
jgi:phosphatidylinositol alpha-1,6-mannosyltransferase